MPNKNTAAVIGLVVFAALVVFFGALLWLSGRATILGRGYTVYFEFPDISGLRAQSPVAMRGFQVGSIRDVTFKPEAVRVTAEIKKKFSIPSDSRVEITTLNFIGEKAVTIVPGTSPAALPPGGTLAGTNRDLMVIAENILTSTKAKIEGSGIDEALRKASESMDALLALVRAVDGKVKKLDMDLYNKRVEDVGQASREIKDLAATISTETKKAGDGAAESFRKFDGTLERVDEALKRLAELSDEVKGLTRKVNESDIFSGLGKTLEELNAFLADIKKNPKKYVRFTLF